MIAEMQREELVSRVKSFTEEELDLVLSVLPLPTLFDALKKRYLDMEQKCETIQEIMNTKSY